MKRTLSPKLFALGIAGSPFFLKPFVSAFIYQIIGAAVIAAVGTWFFTRKGGSEVSE